MLKNLLLIVGVLATFDFLHNVDAIKCYQCTSLMNANCAEDNFGGSANIRQVDCDTAPRPNIIEQIRPVTRCNKVVREDSAGKIISRDCHFEKYNQKEDECLMLPAGPKITECKPCMGDLCNISSAGRLIAVGVATLVAIAGFNIAL